MYLYDLTKESISENHIAYIYAKNFVRERDFTLKSTSAKALKQRTPDDRKFRVAFCHNRKAIKSESVKVFLHESSKKAYFSNVYRCGSVWTCPVCAKKVSEARRLELAESLKNHKEVGGDVLLLTLTNSHSKEDKLKELLKKQKVALKLFLNGTRATKTIFDRMKKVGHIRALEVTCSQANGWHPHFHILLFLKNKINEEHIQSFRDELANLWIKCCQKAALPLPSFQRGVDLRNGHYADKYISKWGVDYELTKSHIKQGRNGSYTPFDLLRLIEEGDKQAVELFREYAEAFHGARQLYWSRGLKKLLKIQSDKTDEEIVNETQHESIQVCEIDNAHFIAIQVFEKHAQFLRVCERDYQENFKRDLINKFLNSLFEQYLIRLGECANDEYQRLIA